MITIYECTDCKHCADFDGWVCCLHPDLKAEDVFHYAPLESKSADNCDGFEEGRSESFSANQAKEANAFAGENKDYMEKMREWALKELKK